MGLFSRKKPQQPLPPVPRYFAPSGPALPNYEPEFHPPEQRMPEFPDAYAEPAHLQSPPPPPSFPRPQVDDKSQPAFIHSPDERLPIRQEPVVRPAVAMPRREPVHMQMPPNQRPAPMEIPVREPAFLRRPVQYPDREAVANQQRLPFQRVEQHPRPVIPDRPLPQPMMPPQPVARPPASFSPPQMQQPQTMSVEDKPLFVKIGQYREAMSHLELLKQKIKEAESALAKIEDLRAKEQAEIANANSMLATIKDKLIVIDKKLFEV